MGYITVNYRIEIKVMEKFLFYVRCTKIQRSTVVNLVMDLRNFGSFNLVKIEVLAILKIFL